MTGGPAAPGPPPAPGASSTGDAAARRPRVGILGGAFNPPHLAHLVLAACAADELDLDRVVLVPTARPPHKAVDDGDPDAAERLELTRLAVADEPGLEVSDVELRRTGPSYTADTLDELARATPGADLVLLLGGDAAAGLPTWSRPELVLARAIIGYTARDGEDPDRVARAIASVAERPGGGPARGAEPFSMPAMGLSSTAIRRRLREGRTVRHLVPRAVEERIVARRLYRPGGPA